MDTIQIGLNRPLRVWEQQFFPLFAAEPKPGESFAILRDLACQPMGQAKRPMATIPSE
jgi:hypothetical protein